MYEGTLNTPQWMKIPILASSYQPGNGRLSNEFQSGVYCCSVNDHNWHKMTATNINVVKECIRQIQQNVTFAKFMLRKNIQGKRIFYR
jgi:hypothetical protein